MQKFSINTS